MATYVSVFVVLLLISFLCFFVYCSVDEKRSFKSLLTSSQILQKATNLAFHGRLEDYLDLNPPCLVYYNARRLLFLIRDIDGSTFLPTLFEYNLVAEQLYIEQLLSEELSTLLKQGVADNRKPCIIEMTMSSQKTFAFISGCSESSFGNTIVASKVLMVKFQDAWNAELKIPDNLHLHKAEHNKMMAFDASGEVFYHDSLMLLHRAYPQKFFVFPLTDDKQSLSSCKTFSFGSKLLAVISESLEYRSDEHVLAIELWNIGDQKYFNQASSEPSTSTNTSEWVKKNPHLRFFILPLGMRQVIQLPFTDILLNSKHAFELLYLIQIKHIQLSPNDRYLYVFALAESRSRHLHLVYDLGFNNPKLIGFYAPFVFGVRSVADQPQISALFVGEDHVLVTTLRQVVKVPIIADQNRHKQAIDQFFDGMSKDLLNCTANYGQGEILGVPRANTASLIFHSPTSFVEICLNEREMWTIKRSTLDDMKYSIESLRERLANLKSRTLDSPSTMSNLILSSPIIPFIEDALNGKTLSIDHRAILDRKLAYLNRIPELDQALVSSQNNSFPATRRHLFELLLFHAHWLECLLWPLNHLYPFDNSTPSTLLFPELRTALRLLQVPTKCIFIQPLNLLILPDKIATSVSEKVLKFQLEKQEFRNLLAKHITSCKKDTLFWDMCILAERETKNAIAYTTSGAFNSSNSFLDEPLPKMLVTKVEPKPSWSMGKLGLFIGLVLLLVLISLWLLLRRKKKKNINSQVRPANDGLE